MSTEVRLRYPISIRKDKRMSEPKTGRGALFTGGPAAILASACCLAPSVLIALGFSGAWTGNVAVMDPYRPIFIGVVLSMFFLAWQRVDLPSGAVNAGAGE